MHPQDHSWTTLDDLHLGRCALLGAYHPHPAAPFSNARGEDTPVHLVPGAAAR